MNNGISDGRNKNGRTKSNCNICNRKLSLYDYKCKCDKLFCSVHKYFTAHNCEYDYKTEYKKKLEKEMIKIIPSKVSEI